jgi:hypothetical protein
MDKNLVRHWLIGLGAAMLFGASRAEANCTWQTGAGANGCGDSCADICKNPGVGTAYFDDTDPNFAWMTVNESNAAAYLALSAADGPPILGTASGTSFYQSIEPQVNTSPNDYWMSWLPRGPDSDSNDPGRIDYFRDAQNTSYSPGMWHDEGSDDAFVSGVGKPAVSELCYSTSFAMAWTWAHANRAPNVQVVAGNWADKYFFEGNSGVVLPYNGAGAPPILLAPQTAPFNASYTAAIRRCGSGLGGMFSGSGNGCNMPHQLQRIANIATYTHTSAEHGFQDVGDAGSYFQTEDQTLDGCPYGGLDCNMNFQNVSYYLYRNNGARLPFNRFMDTTTPTVNGLSWSDIKYSADHGYSSIVHRSTVNVTCDDAVPSSGAPGLPPVGDFVKRCWVGAGHGGHFIALVGYDNRSVNGTQMRKIVYVNPMGAEYTVETNENNTLLDYQMGKVYGSRDNPDCDGSKDHPYRFYTWVTPSGSTPVDHFVLSGFLNYGKGIDNNCQLKDGETVRVYDWLKGMRLSGN